MFCKSLIEYKIYFLVGVWGSNMTFFFFFGCVGSLLLCVGFLYLRWAWATLCWGLRASHRGGFSCCRARALGMRASAVVAHGLQSAGSAVVAHGLNRSMACRIFPDQGLNLCLLHWQAILNHCATREAPNVNYYKTYFLFACKENDFDKH